MNSFSNDNMTEELRIILEDLMDCQCKSDFDVFFSMINQGIWLTNRNLTVLHLTGLQKAITTMSLSMSYLIRECNLSPAHILELAEYLEQSNRSISESPSMRTH